MNDEFKINVIMNDDTHSKRISVLDRISQFLKDNEINSISVSIESNSDSFKCIVELENENFFNVFSGKDAVIIKGSNHHKVSIMDDDILFQTKVYAETINKKVSKTLFRTLSRI